MREVDSAGGGGGGQSSSLSKEQQPPQSPHRRVQTFLDGGEDRDGIEKRDHTFTLSIDHTFKAEGLREGLGKRRVAVNNGQASQAWSSERV
jgi:hypothetical protein